MRSNKRAVWSILYAPGVYCVVLLVFGWAPGLFPHPPAKAIDCQKQEGTTYTKAGGTAADLHKTYSSRDRLCEMISENDPDERA